MSTTVGIKVDDTLRERIRVAAQQLGRTPHWLIKQAVVQYVDALERGAHTIRIAPQQEGFGDGAEVQPDAPQEVQPFLEFAQGILPQTELRAAITASTPVCAPMAPPLIGLSTRSTPRLARPAAIRRIASPPMVDSST